MKILRVSETFQSELKYLEHYLTDELNKKNINTTFLTSTAVPKDLEQFLHTTSFNPSEYMYGNSKIIRLKSASFFNKQIIIQLQALHNLVSKGNYDIIHLQGIGSFVTFSILLIVSFMKKKPVVIINDHSNPQLKSVGVSAKVFYAINQFLFKVTQQTISKIVTVNRASYDFLKKHYSIKNERIQIIPLGYDADVYKNMPELRNDKKETLILGFAGKINEAKNIELLIDVVIDMDNVECRIVGLNEDTLSDYQKTLLAVSDDKVTFYPLIKETQKLAEFYNKIDVAVFPGSISITTIEATGCGTPVILHKSMDGLEDRVENGRGILFESKDELKHAIQKYIDMKKSSNIKHKEIASNSLTYSWKTISEKYLDLYNNFLDNK